MHPSFNDLKNVDLRLPASDEALMPVPNSHPALKSTQIEAGHYGNTVHIREGVAKRLLKAADLLQQHREGWILDVISGYRSLEGQSKLYADQLSRLRQAFPDRDESALVECCHKYIAHPQVAGHPTGGAVDVRIVHRASGEPLDFGSEVWDFSEKSHFDHPQISYEAYLNRNILRSVMLLSGFVPFAPEWWHFSYGDREWAFWKNQSSLYEPVPDALV